MKTKVLIISLIAFSSLFCCGHRRKHNGKATVVTGMEIPAKIQNRKEQIISHIGYTVSYNSDWKIANWVAYQLTAEEVAGMITSKRNFRPDQNVALKHSATNDDYIGCKPLERGHLAPRGDMKWSKQALEESDFLTNICPQNSNLNGGIWKSLEEQVRGLARQKEHIFVVCGPIVSSNHKSIGGNQVAVPDFFYKALLQNINGNYSAIAFCFPNVSGKNLLSTYAMSVDELEQQTGIDFFPALPDNIENKIESEVIFEDWNLK
jgi:endonuclease G